MKRYTYKEVDDFLLTELQTWEARADTLASRLNSMSDDDPHMGPSLSHVRAQERIIDVIGMLRIKFREYNRKSDLDASHDTKKGSAIP